MDADLYATYPNSKPLPPTPLRIRRAHEQHPSMQASSVYSRTTSYHLPHTGQTENENRCMFWTDGKTNLPLNVHSSARRPSESVPIPIPRMAVSRMHRVDISKRCQRRRWRDRCSQLFPSCKIDHVHSLSKSVRPMINAIIERLRSVPKALKVSRLDTGMSCSKRTEDPDDLEVQLSYYQHDDESTVRPKGRLRLLLRSPWIAVTSLLWRHKRRSKAQIEDVEIYEPHCHHCGYLNPFVIVRGRRF